MRQRTWLLAAVLVIWGHAALAQERVQFRSLDAGATVLDGYLYRAADEGRHPAVVFLHGCGGMFGRITGLINRIYQDWATALTGDGY